MRTDTFREKEKMKMRITLLAALMVVGLHGRGQPIGNN
jgi:hypothetical protein